MNLDNLGKSIAERRKMMKMTQERLAEHLEVSTHYIYEIEKCGKTPSFPMMIKIADLFHTTIDSLLSDDENDAIDNTYSDSYDFEESSDESDTGTESSDNSSSYSDNTSETDNTSQNAE